MSVAIKTVVNPRTHIDEVIIFYHVIKDDVIVDVLGMCVELSLCE